MADRMWPQIVDKDSLLHIWHMIEYLGNTIIFFLAGALTGNAMVKIDIVDYLHLIVIYFACMLIRASLLFGARPILNLLGAKQSGQAISVADVTVMTWGGLRGAVGLALAIQVSIDRAGNEIDDEDGRRVLFYVGGIAALTLIVNAPTCPALVRYLGITKTPAARQGMLYRLHAQFQTVLRKGTNAEATVQSMQGIITHIGHDIDHLVPNRNSTEVQNAQSHLTLISAQEICERFDDARKMYQRCIQKGEITLLDMPSLPFVKEEPKLLEFIREHDASPLMVKATYEAFLSLVQHHYWQQIQAGEFVDGTGQGEMLLNSVAFAFAGAGSHLCDLKFIMQKLVQSHDENAAMDQHLTELLAEEDRYDDRCARPSKQRGGSQQRASVQSQSTGLPDEGGLLRTTKVGMALQALPSLLHKRKQQPDSALMRFLQSSVFIVTMSAVLLLNALFIFVEQTQRKGDNYHHKAWLVLEIIFAIIFIFEFAIKLIGYRCYYWLDAWNVFDFLLVGLSVFGVVMELLDTSSSGDAPVDDVSNEARLFRMNRLFRVLRIFRLFRLFKFAQFFQSKLKNEDLSFELAEYLKTITVCRAFAIAHTRAQSDLAKFFGENGGFANAEQMRCVLESQTEVYKAMITAAAEANAVAGNSLVAMKYHRDGIKASSKLRHFIHDAHARGVISSREAETLTHPIDKHVKFEASQMKKTVSGRRASSCQPKDLVGITPIAPDESPVAPVGSSGLTRNISPSESESRTSTKTSLSINPVSAPNGHHPHAPNGFMLPKDVQDVTVSPA